VRRSRKLYLILAVLLAPPFAYWILFYPPVCSDVRYFRLPSEEKGGLRTKLDPLSADLLIDIPDKVEQLNPGLYPNHRIYIYEKSTGRLRNEPWKAWKETVGDSVQEYANPYADCGLQIVKERLLKESGKVLQTAGVRAIRMFPSPRQKFVAVVSTSGRLRPRLPSWPIGLGHGSDGYSGQYYLEILRLPDGERVGRPLRTPLRWAGSGAWSFGGEYFVLFASNRLCVIPMADVMKE